MKRAAFIVALALTVYAGAATAPAGRDGRAQARPLLVSAHHVVVRRADVAPRAQHAVAPRHRSFLLVDAAGAEVRSWPGGPSLGAMPATTPLGSTSWSWVVSSTPRGGWGRIVLPWRPNGRYGWIDLHGRALVHTTTWVEADLSARRVTLMEGDHVLRRFTAAIGTSATPTPTGRFFVTDLVATGDPSGPFGWYAFGLSGHQPNLPAGWGGGDQLAIHGTNDPASIGTPASAGCLRVSADALTILKAHLRLGTPVVIQA